MTLFHVYFALRNQQAFQRLLDTANGRKQPGGSTSNSGGRSWSKSTSTLASAAEVNARDNLGRTVLHLACNAPESLEYVRLLLRNPAVDVNIQDQESRWTPLHRALYHGNVAAAMLLLERLETDVYIKDLEGYTAFELYNSTVQGTMPNVSNRAELFTWGHNRNAALGLGDANDRAHPEQVFIPQPDADNASSIYARFQPLPVQRVYTAKLHTVVITSEKEANLRVCGFASGGRLGPGQHTQYGLTPIAGLSQTIVSVALGQDHTLALTDSGEVLSWGLNRFSQLGYTVETTSGKLEEPVQPSPKKIIALKKEVVRGVAACRTASVCWTSTQVFAWGTSNGQLGFDKHQPTVVPRIVSKITRPVVQVCLTESALVCLLDSQDVVCLWSGRVIKINFPAHGFPHAMQPYRPPQAARGAHTIKITSCDETIAALSSDGQVFAFSIPPPAITEPAASTTHKAFQPYTVWTPRMQHMSARDAAVGNNGTVIICTKSGHIFIPSKKGGVAGKALKYQVVPNIQRVVSICANSTGAFGALRVDFNPPPIVLAGQVLSQHLSSVLPCLWSTDMDSDNEPIHDTRALGEEDDEDSGDMHILDDANRLKKLENTYTAKRTTLEAWRDDRDSRLPQGADMSVLVQQSGHVLPVHRVILSARSTVLNALLRDDGDVRDDLTRITVSSSPVDGRNRLIVQRAHPMAVLLLLDYLYSDHILAIWDHRLALVGVDSAKVKSDVQGLARLLQLPALTRALHAATRSVPEPTIHQDMAALFSAAQESKTGDVVLQFADQNVFCHSAVLRSRTQFFADFFGEEEWTRKRWNNGQVTIDLKHMKWHVMSFVMRALYSGENINMFSVLDFTQSSEDVLEFMFEIIHAATELHFDRLVLVASTVILRLLTINNASYILSEATHYSAHDLVKSVQEYIAVNMEALLECRILDSLHPTTVKQLSRFVKTMQTTKMPTTRTGLLEQRALAKHATWVAEEDFPVPILPSSKEIKRRASAKLSPTEGFGTSPLLNTSPPRPRVSATASTISSPAPEKEGHDDIFTMDDEPATGIAELGLKSQASLDRMAPWKPSMKTRVDMRSVMAETAAASTKPVISSTPPRTPALRSTSTSGSSSSPWRTQTANTPPASTGVHFPTLSASPKTPSKTPGPAAQNVIKVARPPSGSPSVSSSGAGRPDMGPVFVPTRQIPQSSGSKGPQTPSRRSVSGTTSNKAWTRPPAEPVTPPPPSGIAMSFAEIQQSQEFRPVEKEKRTLLEIQEEEQARLVEQDFMKWWEEEEERVRLEQQREEQAIKASLREAKTGHKGGGGARQRRAAHKGGPSVEGASNGAGKKKKKQPAKAN
ncbi:hypothetical protein CYLTODRAFT_401654 [Cylindrobasidium torrendii FP15055 ss-10]|uniref:BTB domain-containing protein n=1 Tax=Cylindrobasidium torrendii FP15055 ss-10 TaxID=1314674 RepID=A0A0D7B1S6_9AGAR|nr:hypothetical protein CYLTODRAFT_401654 [Cylindrobasidium torrendii FP15055 ss-10]